MWPVWTSLLLAIVAPRMLEERYLLKEQTERLLPFGTAIRPLDKNSCEKRLLSFLELFKCLRAKLKSSLKLQTFFYHCRSAGAQCSGWGHLGDLGSKLPQPVLAVWSEATYLAQLPCFFNGNHSDKMQCDVGKHGSLSTSQRVTI